MKLLFWLLFALSIYGQDGNYIWKDSTGIYYGNENKIIFKSGGFANVKNNIICDFIGNEKYYEYKLFNTITKQCKNGRYYFYDSTNTLNMEYPGRLMGAKYIPEEETFLLYVLDEHFCQYKYDIRKNELSNLIECNLEIPLMDCDLRNDDLITLKAFPHELEIMDIKTKSSIQVIPPMEYYTPEGYDYWKAVRFKKADSLLLVANAPEFMIYDLNSKKFITSIIGVEGIKSIEFFDHKYDNKIYFCSSSENTNGKLFFKIFSIDLSTFIIKEVFQIESKNGYTIINSIDFNLDNDGFIHLTTVNHSRTKELLPSLYDYYCIEAKTGEIKLKKENMTTLDKIILSSPSAN